MSSVTLPPRWCARRAARFGLPLGALLPAALVGAALLAAPAAAQDRLVFHDPGRQVVRCDDYLLELTYGPSWVRIRLYDWEGRPLDLSRVHTRMGSVSVVASDDGAYRSRAGRIRYVAGDGAPYLEMRHGLGALPACGELQVAGRIYGTIFGRNRYLWFDLRWQDGRPGLRAPACRGDGCPLCAAHLCARD